jgi:hypothetical protein
MGFYVLFRGPELEKLVSNSIIREVRSIYLIRDIEAVASMILGCVILVSVAIIILIDRNSKKILANVSGIIVHAEIQDKKSIEEESDKKPSESPDSIKNKSNKFKL